jgi:hypothetical protein
LIYHNQNLPSSGSTYNRGRNQKLQIYTEFWLVYNCFTREAYWLLIGNV